MGNSMSVPHAENWSENWLKRSWVLALHKRLGALYLQRFLSCFPDEQTITDWAEAWAQGLAGISDEQMRYGLTLVIRQYEWPPTCKEFRDCCEAMPRAYRVLPDRARGVSEHGLNQIAKIKELLAQPTRKPGKWWAHEIIERHEAGIHVLPRALELATEALK